jgi:hypothetical protein
LSLFPDDREIPADAVDSLQVKLSGVELRRPRLFGSRWLGCQLWQQLGLDEFWDACLAGSREDVAGEKVLQLLVVNRLLDAGSEFSCRRHPIFRRQHNAKWFGRSLAGTAFGRYIRSSHRIRQRLLRHALSAP